MILTPPPPALVKEEAAVVSFLQAHGFSFPQIPTLMMMPSIDPITGGPMAGSSALAYAYPGTITVAPLILKMAPDARLGTLLHESLHETVTGGSWDYLHETSNQFMANEQATEAMTRILIRSAGKAVGVKTTYGDFLYPQSYNGAVKRLRVASARACSCGWQTARARAFVANFFLTNPLSRSLYQ